MSVKDPAASRAALLASELAPLVGKLKRRLREQGPPGELTWSQVAVLGLLEREGRATVSALARAENMRSQSMGAIVAELEAAGLVTGAPDPADGRQTLWSLTRKCRDWIRAQREAREDWLCQIIQTRLASREQEELARGLELLKRIVEP